MDFYVYIHRKKTNGEVFYVGKGKNWRATNKTQRNKFWKRVVKKYGLVVEIVEKDIQEWYAHELEIYLIAYYGRRDQGLGPLVNLTDGGEGSSGYKHTSEVLGANHPNFDNRLWRFRNVFTNDLHVTTQYDFQNAHPDLNVRSLVNRKTSTFGWIIEGYTPQIVIERLLNGNTGNNNQLADKTIYSFINLKTKELFIGSRSSFHEKYGIRVDFLLCKNPLKTLKDWSLLHDKKVESKADYTIYHFVHEGGLTFTGTRREMEKKFGFVIHDLVRKDVKKRAKRIKGWSLAPKETEELSCNITFSML